MKRFLQRLARKILAKEICSLKATVEFSKQVEDSTYRELRSQILANRSLANRIELLEKLKEPATYPIGECPPWTAEDAQRWKEFLANPTGQSLWRRARARETSLAISACRGTEDPKTVGGITFALNWLESLARPEIISSAEDAKSATTEYGMPEDAVTSHETSTK
jgi:hypothetical protein